MSEVNVCSVGVQWKILQCEEVLTVLFVVETQLECASSPPPLNICPFLSSLASHPFLCLLLCFSVYVSHPSACTVEPTAGREGIREGGR